jgi:hypothetical protein
MLQNKTTQEILEESKDKKKLNKAEKYMIQLLEQPSMKHLYKTRLDKHIKGRTGDINQDWTSLKTIITKTAKEVLGLQNK